MSIVITGASGKLGRLVTEAVAETVSPSDVILVSRTPDGLGEYADRGFVVRHGDFDDPVTLPAAFAGAERMLLISTDVIGTRLPGHQAAIDAAVAAGVQAIAYTGIPNPSHSNPGAAAVEHGATEDMLRRSGAAWTFLRNSIYTEMLLLGAPAAVESGKLVTNAGEGRTSYISRADCAAAAAAVLTTEGHDNKAYDITGAEALSQADIAALLSEVGGRTVEPVYLDDESWIATMVEHAGMPEPVARIFATFGRATREGFLAVTSTTFEELTARKPTPVRAVLEAHRSELAGVSA